MARLGMVIDTVKCVGCMDCVVACKTENQLPEGFDGRATALHDEAHHVLVTEAGPGIQGVLGVAKPDRPLMQITGWIPVCKVRHTA